MTLDRLSQITEVGIKSGITLNGINVIGVVTATSLTVNGGAVVNGVVTATSFSGNVTGNITPTGLVVSGVSTFQSSSFWGDGDIAYFGDGQDLLIFHNSTDSIIRDNGTGDLNIEGGNRIKLMNPTGIETYAVFNQDGASELWYDNAKKFETTGAGVSITGIASATSGFVGNLTGNVTGNVNATGLSTFSGGPVLIGGGTSTGTASQPLQVTGGAYVSGNFGIGTTNPSSRLHVVASATNIGILSVTEGSQPKFLVNGSTASTDAGNAVFSTGTGFDSSHYMVLQNNTDLYGRVGLVIRGKTFNGASNPSANDGWSLAGARSTIRFDAYLTGDTGYDTKFSIQHLMANGSTSTVGDLGIFAKGYSTTAPAVVVTGAGNFQFNSGYGSAATAYGCRAWVNFNGTTASPSTIRGSGNVTSVTKTGTGSYTINFTTALVDANYVCTVSASSTTDAINLNPPAGVDRTASSLRIDVESAAPAQFDAELIDVAIFR